MHSYHLRIELHGALQSDYTTLHTQMAKSGFQTTVTAGNGTKFYLPQAEYVVTGNHTINQVVDAAKLAAQATKKSFSVFAVEYTQWMSWNLTVA